MQNFYELAAQANAIAKQNGFDDPTWDTFPMKVMLVVTEVTEAIEAAENRDALLEELADIALRTLAILHCVWEGSWSASRVGTRGRPLQIPIRLFQPIETLLYPVLRQLAKSVEDWRYGRQDDARIRLEMSLMLLWDLANALGADLYAVCLIKCEKNKARGHLHGKAIRSEG